MEKDFTKVVNIGQTSVDGRPFPVYCKIKFNNGVLYITGVVGPLRNGDCAGSSGQIHMSLRASEVHPAEGWDVAKIEKFLSVWDTFHLSDMFPGSPAQTKYLASLEAPNHSYFEWACSALTKAGLNPDPDYLHNGKPYAFGSDWLRIEVPEEIVGFLSGLPETKKQPAWV